MAVALIDTSIVIDILRGYPPALEWFDHQTDLAICRVVWLEVLEGANTSQSQRSALKLLRRFPTEELVTQDLIWATQSLQMVRLSHNVDVFDCLIASVNQRLQLPLYTRNIKHFAPLLGTLVVRPY